MDIAERIGTRFKYRFVAQILSVVSGAVLIVALARLLDPDGYGLLFLALSVFSIVQLFSKLGIGKSAARYISEYKETSIGQIPHIIRFSFYLNIFLILLVSVVFFFFRELIAELIGEPDLEPFLFIGVLFIAFVTLFKYVNRVLQGFEAIQATSVLLALDRVGRLLFALGLVVVGYGALGALAGYIIATAIASTVGLVYLYYKFYIGAGRSEREEGLRQRIAKYAIPLTATSTANKIDKQVDTVLVGFFIGPAAVAFYTISKQIVTFIQAPMNALGFTISPMYEAQKAKGNDKTASHLYEEALFHALLLYMPAAAGLILVSDPLVALVFGDEYIGAAPVLQVLAVYTVFLSITQITSNGLDFLGRARERAIIKTVTSVLNVGLNIVLIPALGVVGAAIATNITYGIYTLLNIYIIGTELDLRTNWLIKRIGGITIITLVMAMPVYFAVDYVSGFTGLFAVVGMGIALWGAASVLFGYINPNKIQSVLL